MKKTLNSIIAVLMAVMMIFALVACGNTANEDPSENPSASQSTDADSSNAAAQTEDGLWKDAKYLEDTEFGNGKTTVQLEVKAGDKSVTFTVKTDKETLGDALIEHDLIAGDEGEFGLYVKVVNGITADYDVDQSYWSFLKDGEMMMTGVDGAKIADGEHYELVYTK